MTDNNIEETTAKLEIVEPLVNIFIEENSDAIFECKVIGRPQLMCSWLKNGRPVDITCQRIKLNSDGKGSHYRLIIRNANVADHGLYTAVFNNNFVQQSTSASLFVAPTALNCGVKYSNANKTLNRVITQLRNTKVLKGSKLELIVRFKCVCADGIVWFRNNERVYDRDDRILLLISEKCSILTIYEAELTDSGVYCAVSETQDGTMSSFADVLVTEHDESLGEKSEDHQPIIEELLPDEIECNAGEDIRLICKVNIAVNTKILWLQDAIAFRSSNFIEHEYGDCYIGLQGVNISEGDAGIYTLVITDKITGKDDSCDAIVIVNPCPTKSLPVAKLKRPLKSAVACSGSKVTFDCSFSLSDPTYFYVTWHVGHYRVQRSNSRFSVLCKGGEFMLFIKKLEPGMTGVVTCELWKVLPNQKTVFVNSTSSTLAVVPISYFESDKDSKAFVRLYNSSAPCEQRFLSGSENIEKMNERSPDSITVDKDDSGVDSLMEIMYCRLDEDGLYYVHTSRFSSDVAHVSVYHRLQNDCPKNAEVTVITWCDSLPPLTCWYEIKLGQVDGSFITAGVSSSPSLELEVPPVGRLMIFRVGTAPILSDVAESTVHIVPTPETVLRPLKSHQLQPMENFASRYTKTEHIIGSGAFGSVVLVQDEKSQHYAAKILKTLTQKKRDAARREFDIMKQLRHPKLVELIDVYVSKDVFILVMDYLWGGELFYRMVEEDDIKEVDVIPYVKQICEALQYLHTQNIAHLDLKPENIICLSPNSGQIKIIDFGIAKVLTEDNVTRAIYGTREYVAPEVLNYERLTLACDMWSLGVITYILLSGLMPFAGETWPERSVRITRADYNYEDIAFREISYLAKNFVDQLLILDARKRMSAADALNHSWIKQGPPQGSKAGHMKQTRENMKSYLANYRAKWQRAGNVMIAAHRFRTHAGNQRAGRREENSPDQCIST